MEESKGKAAGISHAPLDREHEEQEKVPPRGEAKENKAADATSKAQDNSPEQD